MQSRVISEKEATQVSNRGLAESGGACKKKIRYIFDALNQIYCRAVST